MLQYISDKLWSEIQDYKDKLNEMQYYTVVSIQRPQFVHSMLRYFCPTFLLIMSGFFLHLFNLSLPAVSKDLYTYMIINQNFFQCFNYKVDVMFYIMLRASCQRHSMAVFLQLYLAYATVVLSIFLMSCEIKRKAVHNINLQFARKS